MSLVASNRLRVNSVVLLRHIDTVAKREPLRLARISEIHTSRDGSQRVVAVTYHNVHQNKQGEWVGNKVSVKRQVSDTILMDDDLDEVMLGPDTKRHTDNENHTDAFIETHHKNIDSPEATNDTTSNPSDSQQTPKTDAQNLILERNSPEGNLNNPVPDTTALNDSNVPPLETEAQETSNIPSLETEAQEMPNVPSLETEAQETSNAPSLEAEAQETSLRDNTPEGNSTNTVPATPTTIGNTTSNVRRSKRVRKQVMEIDTDDIGEDDDPTDPNYE